jgi:formate dehydrogenase subunit delta
MNVERLVAMVNDISAFFAAEAGADAPAAVATHLRRFWDPRMRAQIIAAFRDDPGGLRALSAVGRAAVAELASSAPSSSSTRPT